MSANRQRLSLYPPTLPEMVHVPDVVGQENPAHLLVSYPYRVLTRLQGFGPSNAAKRPLRGLCYTCKWTAVHLKAQAF